MTVCHTHFFAPCQVPHKPDKMDDTDPALDVQAALQDLVLKIRDNAYMLAPEWIQHAKPRQYLPGRAGILKSIMEICRKLLRLQAAKQLEYAFDFMESAFAGGQELVVFITELNTSSPAVAFLQEYSCERYYRYNKELLFRENTRDILERIRQLG